MTMPNCCTQPQTKHFLTAYDLDAASNVPHALRLRAIHVLALATAVVMLAGALEWPHAWRLIALLGLAAMSVLFALAAGREWWLGQRRLSLLESAPLRPAKAANHVQPFPDFVAAAIHGRPLLTD